MTKSAETSFSKKYELPQFSLKFINSSRTVMNEVLESKFMKTQIPGNLQTSD